MDKKTILIIEDDTFFQNLISKKLVNEGFEVLVASDSRQALSILEEKKPNLIVLDLILPVLDGFGILSIIKKDEKTKDIPVIILSNLGQKEEIEKAIALGAVDFMIKVNFTPEEIVRKIKSII
ncbi:response regulator [Patescibacteria group bacterium]|nr:response regulator [Patescibacteria group bacterium]MBU2218999.1 response regulator [Patescibacteria group bacterium]MBU2263076.1 response regulator [Patescibacteria group bacterium]